MPVKKAGLVLLNPVTSAQQNYLSSTQGSTELTWSVTGGGAFSNNYHLWTISEERRDRKKYQDAAYKTKLKDLECELKGTDKSLILRAKISDAWMVVRGTTVPGTVLSATEYRYFLCSRYKVSPINLQSHCNGCGTSFGVTHTLICSIGGLVIVCHK